MSEATTSLDLAPVQTLLRNWRPVAWTTRELGHDGYRRMMASVEETIRTGAPRSGSRPIADLRSELGLGQ